jgi:hypothetical protein
LPEARALEAEFRARLGDVTGASLSYARLREILELGTTDEPKSAADWLRAAARFERDVTQDAVAAERHLAVALKIAPRDREVAEAYREAAALLRAREASLR